MSCCINFSSAKNIIPLHSSLHFVIPKCSFFPRKPDIIIITSRKRNAGVESLITNRASRTPRRVVTIPSSKGGWPGKWTCEYIISLKDLRLGDLAYDGRTDTEVYVSLLIHKHTGLGLSVEGKVITSIVRKCTSCSSLFCREIDTGIRVWVLPEEKEDPSTQMPAIGGDDPSVIYVKPGYEADLDSLIQDTIRLQTSVKVDLVGGYYDAGDHVKFGLPMAYSVTLMAWAAIDFSTQLVGANQMESTLEAIKWGTDYFIKAHIEDNVLWAQVGEGEADHKCWERAEEMTTPRTAYRLDSSKPGSDLAGETAAALAASSLAFKDSNSSYSTLLLDHAKQLFSFADNFRGHYDDSILDAAAFYPSSGFSDELLWAAAWLYRATNEDYYLQYAVDNAVAFNGTEHDVKIFSWDNKYAGLQVLLTKILLDGNGGTYISTLKKYKAKADYFACAYMQKNDGNNVPMTPGGLVYLLPSINLQYVASAAFLLGIYSDYIARTSSVIECPDGQIRPQDLLDFSKSQADYILGKNPNSMSYLVGYGTKYPNKAHHRGSSIPIKSAHTPPVPVGCEQGFDVWYKSPDPNPNVLNGALIGGPDRNDCFEDNRDNYDQNEATTCSSAPLIGLFSMLHSLSGYAGSKSEYTYTTSMPLSPHPDSLAPTSLSPRRSGEESAAPSEVIVDYVLTRPSNLAAVNKRAIAYAVVLVSFILL